MEKSSYILRYFLPCEPICDAHVTKRRMDSLIAYCLENRIEAVMLYVDLHPYWYYAPDSLEHTGYNVEVLQDLIDLLRHNGISYQLNYQNLIGAWDGGADLRDMNGWEYFVDQYGLESQSSACCIGEKFRQIAGEKLALWAQTKPDMIWIDDDIRFHNHGAITRDAWQGKPHTTDFGCFCENHIKLFNETYHTNCDRESLVAGIYDGSLREQWLEFSKNCADEFMAWIEKTIHSVSPDTRIAMMTSLPDIHSVEGRNWGSFLENLNGGQIPVMRPTFGPYEETFPHGFYDSYLFLEQLKTNIRSQYQKPFVLCPEIENTRFTVWSKSLAGTSFQLGLAGFSGCKGITLSIYDLEGCILEEEPELAQLLTARRPLLDMLAQEPLWEMENQGIALLTAPERAGETFRGKKVSQMVELAGRREWDKQLLKAGIPCCYLHPADVKKATGVALDTYTASMLNEEETKTVLSGGVLLTAGAAQVLWERGFGEFLGVGVGDFSHCIAATEVFHTVKRSDGSQVRVPLRAKGYHWNQLTTQGAQIITSFVTPYGTEFPGITRFTNQLGGTVYVFAQNGDFGDGFYSHYRIDLLKGICFDISQNSIVVSDNRSYALTIVKENEKNKLIYFANMTADCVETVSFSLPEVFKEAQWLDENGVSYPAIIQKNRIICEGVKLPLYGSIILKINK